MNELVHDRLKIGMKDSIPMQEQRRSNLVKEAAFSFGFGEKAGRFQKFPPPNGFQNMVKQICRKRWVRISKFIDTDLAANLSWRKVRSKPTD